MSILTTLNKISKEKESTKDSLSLEKYWSQYEKSPYQLSDKEKETLSLILRCFSLGDVTMNTPRVEFNDLSVQQRDQIDQMAWNTYQPNNGDAPEFDELNSWKSRAIRPIVRNKAISIAAHSTARLIFPKIFAYNRQSESQSDAARVMEELMEWAADKSNYSFFSLLRVIQSLYSPASIGYTEYAEVYRTVKRPTEKTGIYSEEKILDETLSGFQDYIVPVDQLYIENFYEPDIQKQGWLIWRRVHSFSLLKAKYGHIEAFQKYVRPGVQNIYNDANQNFYYVYDPNMRQEDGEEIIFWNKDLDLKVILVNGVFMTPHDNPNPRNDKLYPFDKFGYELINSKCFYYKSLAFKLQPDANILNTLYSMIIDGTYLNLMPPMVGVGGETISAEVLIPGAVTTLSSPDSDLRPITTSNNLTAGFNALQQVSESINESSQDPIQSGQDATKSGTTAYEISRLEQNAATVLGLFIKMISKFVKEYGKLRLGDIIQYLTIADVDKITDNPELIYRTFYNPQRKGKVKNRRIMFDASIPEEMTESELLDHSYSLLKEQKEDEELFKVNPELFRNLTYSISITPDVLNPMSEDLERAYALETFDRAIQLPNTDHDELTKNLLLSTSPITKKDPDKFMAKQALQDPIAMATKDAKSPLDTANNPMRQLSSMPQAQS